MFSGGRYGIGTENFCTEREKRLVSGESQANGGRVKYPCPWIVSAVDDEPAITKFSLVLWRANMKVRAIDF